MSRAPITDYQKALVFMFGGNATFTLVSKKTGTRFTYRMRKPKDAAPHANTFVAVLTGSDNESSYSYLGFFKVGKGYSYGSKSKIGPEAPSAVAFHWFANAMLSNKGLAAFEQVEFYHEGSCCRCGRKLTVPESITDGIGPECRKFVASAA